MSNVSIIQTYSELLIGADSAVSAKIDNVTYRIATDGQKLFTIDEMIIFCSGRMGLSNDVISKFRISNSRTVSELLKIAKSEYAKFSFDEDEIGLEILIGAIEDGKSVLYQLSPYNNFDVIKREVSNDDVAIWSGGLKTKKSSDFLYSKLTQGNSFIESLVDVFNHISCEEIGGKLSIYKVSNEITKLLETDIIEENQLRYIEDIFTDNKSLVIAERLIGQIIAGNDLTITNRSGSFTVNDNGMTVTDMNLSLKRVDNKSRVVINANDGLKIQSSANGTTWNDKLSANANGDVTLTGALTTGTGATAVRADTNGLYIGSSTFNNAPVRIAPTGDATFNGSVTASNFSVTGGKFNINNSFIVDEQGNLTANNANLSGNINMTSGSLNWANLNSDPVATTAGNIAGMAYNAAQQIAAGTYTGGTFINGKMIYSPTIMTGTSGRYLKLEGSKLESVNSGTKNGITLDGSDGSIKWYNNNNQVGSIYTFRNTSYDTLTVQHNAVNLYGDQEVLINAGYGIQIGASSGFTTFTGNVSFSNANSVTGITAKFG